MDELDPAAAVEELAGSMTPWLFGVRHHSPACAAALPPLLDALAPTAVAIELPADLAPWLAWLGHPDAEAPLAVAAVAEHGDELGFYPFADFSPELAAIRWARAHDVPVHAIDLPASRRAPRDRASDTLGIDRRLASPDDDSWDHLIERRAPGSEPERIRRAALLYGWALRVDEARGGGVSALDRAREGHMRSAIEGLQASGARVAAIVGAFHAAALLPTPRLWTPVATPRSKPHAIVSSLIPYAFELLDARSGYPAGIRDPRWHQRLWETLSTGGDVGALVAACLVEITRAVRAAGLPASVPDAGAAAEVASSLAQLRGIPAPGRRELVEAVQSALAQGELMGRGRVVARAMEDVLVGRQRGTLAPGTPRSGLGPHVAALMAELRLPFDARASAAPVDLELDPLRSRIDRRRHVALCRLRACSVPYGTELEALTAAGLDSLIARWRVKLTPSTEAMLELAGLRGVTLRQAAIGALRADRARLAAEDKLSAPALVALCAAAAEAGAGELVSELLVELTGPRLVESSLAELIALVALVDRIAAGHLVGLPQTPEAAVIGEIDRYVLPTIDRDAVLSTAVASVLGLAGSESLDDVRALAELVRLVAHPDRALGDGRLRWAVAQLAQTGTPLIAGAASVVEVLLGAATAEALSVAIGGWLDAAVDATARRALADRLRGALAIAGPLFEASGVFLADLMSRVEQLSDDDFLARVAPLRTGFDVLSNASRKRLLRVLGERLGELDPRGLDVTTTLDPARLAVAAEADRAGRAAIAHIPRVVLVDANRPPEVVEIVAARVVEAHDIGVRDRWRMILGHEREKMAPRPARAARALDELYGAGHGEGSREERTDTGEGGGDEGFPTVRAWREEIEAVFGGRVFEEVAAQAAAAGRIGALLELDPEGVAPSIDLLQQVLALKGGLGEAHVARLRVLIKHVVDDLVRELAVRVRPALLGSTSARGTRRPSPQLHLSRTVAANLAHVRMIDGEQRLVPERLFFRARNRRQMDWQIVLVVDVSGSMEPSVIYSAMMAAILASVPWVSVRFVAFSTEIVDLSEHVADPLALLLEVSVGGGTHIAKGLRYARSLVEVPQRTIVITLSDFEEGPAIDGLLGEVRALVEAGVTCLGLAALDDRGAPRYAVPIAEQVAAAGMPIAALTPLELARWIGERLR